MSISVIGIVRDKIIVPSLLRAAVISPVNSDFENESNITNSYRRICEINDHASYFRGETSYLNLNGSPDCFKNYENIFLYAFNCLDLRMLAEALCCLIGAWLDQIYTINCCYNQLQKYLRHCTVFWLKWPVHDIVLVTPLPRPLIKVASNTRPFSKLGGKTLNGREEGGQNYISQTSD